MTLVLSDPDRYSLDDLLTTKAEVRALAREAVESWYDGIGELGRMPTTSDLSDDAEALWRDLFYFNEGIFAGGPDPLDGFVVLISSYQEKHPPLVLGPRIDGWGAGAEGG